MKAPVAGFEPAYHCFKGSWLTVSQHPSVTVGLLFSNFKLHSSNFFLAPAAGIEPATKRLTVALPYQHRTHRNVSGGRRTRTIDLQGMNLASYQLLHPAKRPARIELASSAWQADGLPLHHGRETASQPNCQRSVGVRSVKIFKLRTSLFKLPKRDR